ncbi:MAG: hypothetical protein ACC742_15435, partial [Thermoanaerobaculales bacterium]
MTDGVQRSGGEEPLQSHRGADELTAPVTEASATEDFKNPAPDWDRYTIVGFVGEGAMGRVYRAVDQQ